MSNRNKRIYLNIAGLVAVAASLLVQSTMGVGPLAWGLLVLALVFMLASRYLRSKDANKES
jgi:hypothetical protein